MSKIQNIEFAMGKVLLVEERFTSRHVRGAAKDAEFEDVSTGWFVTVDNGTSLGFGALKPDCEVGETLIVSFRRGLP